MAPTLGNFSLGMLQLNGAEAHARLDQQQQQQKPTGLEYERPASDIYSCTEIPIFFFFSRTRFIHRGTCKLSSIGYDPEITLISDTLCSKPVNTRGWDLIPPE